MGLRSAAAIIGREHERVAVEAVLEDPSPTPSALILEGEAGIGKSILWGFAVERASGSEVTLLTARPAESETSLPFAGLGDLLAEVAGDVIPALPAPQRHALEVALQLAEPDGSAGSLSLARALTTILRTLAAERTLVLAIDDVQWLDPPSENALAFAVRRLAGSPVRLVLSRRSDQAEPAPLDLDHALRPERLHTLRIGPLALDEVDLVLRSRLELQLPRPVLAELHRASGGNTFYALELGRSARRQPDGSFDLLVPPTLNAALEARLSQLPEPARDAALLAAASRQPTSDVVERAARLDGALRAAIEAGVLSRDGERLRFVHPLFSSVTYATATPAERRDAHRRLAAATSSDEERAHQLGLSSEQADEGIATTIEAAAASAAGRGAPEAAAVLAEHAARLSVDDSARRRRLQEAAEHHIACGNPARGRTILEQLIAGLEPGRERAALLWRLADTIGDTLDEPIALCKQALSEAEGDPALEAEIHVALSVFTWLQGELGESIAHCHAAAERADAAGDEVLTAVALGELCHAQAVRGDVWDRGAMARALAIEERVGDFPTYSRPSFQLAVLSTYTDELETARPLFHAELGRVDARGDASARTGVLFRLAELEHRAGNWARALELARECDALAAQTGTAQEQSVSGFALGLALASVGETDEARELATRSLGLAREGGDRMVAVRALGVLGFVELSLGAPEAALTWLDPAAAELKELGIGELSISGVVQNQIEALVAVGSVEEADEAIAFVERCGAATGRAWHRAVAARGRALVAAAGGREDEARAAIVAALEAHAVLPQPFELARTLLVQGAVERRTKRWGAARTALAEAVDRFDQLGAGLWAERAAAELARLPGRPRANGRVLTPTEHRVAELVAAGRSNKEVASTLYITVRTVEANLSKVYAKLGIRSRTQLAHHLDAALVESEPSEG